ncbi:MAG TPA: hypothetical protein VF525_12325 [Pyrinomonadaceae bacterium]|jgi:opacity protein-like surface antigen
MSKSLLTLATLVACCLSLAGRADAQEHDAPRYEVGALFSAITFTPSNGYRTEAGFGGRFTVNLTDHIGLEAETVFFPNSGFSAEQRAAGRALQGQFGVKAGKRWEKWGVFAKGRPGFISFNNGRLVFDTTNTGTVFASHFERATHFAFDVGGVLELYPTRHIVTRFDAGDTIIRYGRQSGTSLVLNPVTGQPEVAPFVLPANTRHNFQFNAGIGYRFDD